MAKSLLVTATIDATFGRRLGEKTFQARNVLDDPLARRPTFRTVPMVPNACRRLAPARNLPPWLMVIDGNTEVTGPVGSAASIFLRRNHIGENGLRCNRQGQTEQEERI
jgi:hypothetical protein